MTPAAKRKYMQSYLADREKGRTDLLWLCQCVLSYKDIRGADIGWEDPNNIMAGENHQPLIDGLHKFAGRKEIGDIETLKIVSSEERVEMYHQREPDGNRNFLALFPRDHLKCVPYGEKVQVASGHYKNIEDIKSGDEVLGMDDGYGLAWNSVQATRSNHPQPCVEISFRSGRVIRLSENHPVRMLLEWKNAGDLKKGDRTAIAGKVEPTSTISSDYAGILGWFLGDGSFTAAVVTNSDAHLRQRIMQSATRAGFTAYETFPANRAAGVRIQGAHPLWKRLGLKGITARDKFIPDEVFGWDKASIRELLFGYFMADGTFTRLGISCTSVSRELIVGVQRLLLRFDINSRFAQYGKVGAWFLYVSTTEMVKRFLDEIGWEKKVFGDHLRRGVHKSSVINSVPNEVRQLLPKGFHSLGREPNMRWLRLDAKYSVSKEKLRRVGTYLDHPKMLQLAKDDIYWDEVKSVVPIGMLPTIDLQVEGGTFAVSDLITHNTSICTIAHTIQWIINYPDVRVLLSFSSGDHGDRIMTAILGHFRYNETFRWLYPEFCPEAKRAKEFGSLASFTVPARTRQITEPTVMAVSVGKMIAGTHQDVHKHSDLVDKENVKTSGGIRDVNDHFKYTDPLLARVAGKQGWRDVEGTPYDYSDLYGEIRDGEAAKEPEDRSWRIVERAAQVNATTGKTLWPHRYTWDALDKIKDLVGLYIFEAQYNMRCIAPSGGLATRDEIRFIPRARVRELMPQYRIHTTVDLASMDEESNGDYIAITTAGFLPSGYIHIIDIRHGHFSPFQVIDHFFDIHAKFRPRDFKVEKNHHAQVLEPFLRQEMQKRGIYLNVLNIPRSNVESKKSRIKGLQPFFQAKRLLFVDDLPCAGELVMEVTRFDKFKYDDILDTLSDQLQHADGRGIEPDLYPLARDPAIRPWWEKLGQPQFRGFDPYSHAPDYGEPQGELSEYYHARTGL